MVTLLVILAIIGIVRMEHLFRQTRCSILGYVGWCDLEGGTEGRIWYILTIPVYRQRWYHSTFLQE